MDTISVEQKQSTNWPGAWLRLEHRAGDAHIFLALAIAVFAVFANSLSNGFVYDDHILIESNYALRDWSYLTGAFTNSHSYDVSWLNFGSSMVDYYRPFTRMLFALAFQAFGLQTEYWHLLNVSIYFVVIILGYIIVKQLSGSRTVAAAGILLFAVHPIHSEVVAWVNCMVETLHALFFLGAFALYLRAEKVTEAGKKRLFFFGSLALVAAALLSKETALCFPILIAAYRFIHSENKIVRRTFVAARAAVPFLFVVAGYFVLRYSAYGGTLKIASGLPMKTVFLTIPSIILEYIRMFIFPTGLSAVHSVPFVSNFASLRFWLPLALLVAVAVIIYLRAPRHAVFACAWIIITMLPVLNIGLFTSDLSIQDRYAFLPSLGCCSAVAMGLDALLLRKGMPEMARQVLAALFILSVVSLSGLAVRQNRFWKNDFTLFARAAEQNPNSEFAQCNYGSVLYAVGNGEEAARRFTLSFKIKNGESACGCAGLGKYYASQRNYDQAIQFYESAIELGEGNVNLQIFTDLAIAYYQKNQGTKAINLLKETVAKYPDFQEARLLLEQLTQNK
jgi:protein O-mannosyl-transferase